MAKKRLGIDALFQTSIPSAVPEPATPSSVDEIELDRLSPSPGQPRTYFDDASLSELADSIRAHGVLQPILVRQTPAGAYEIVAGERRWRAARIAGLDAVPVRILEIGDADVLAVAMVENLQREDLNPLEEAEGYLDLLRHRLEAEPSFSQYAFEGDARAGVVRILRALNNRIAGNTKDDVVLGLEPIVAEVFTGVGRITWPSFVAHRLPLLSMPEDVTAALRSRLLDYTKARLVARITAEKLSGDDERARKLRRELLDQIATEGMSVRSLQAEIARILGLGRDAKRAAAPVAAVTPTVEEVAQRSQTARQRLGAIDFGSLAVDDLATLASVLENLITVLEGI